MKITDILLLITLAAIWGSSFIFMRATAESFGPIALIAFRIIFAALCMSLFLFNKKHFKEFIQNWPVLLLIGLFSTSLAFSLLAYASLSLTGGTVSILNAMTPIFTALIAHFVLNNLMSRIQFIGMFISIAGLLFLVWENLSWNIESWLPTLAGIGAAIFYGISNNLSKKYLANVSVVTSSSGSLLFSAIFMSIALAFFMPDFSIITKLDWLYALILGVVCTAIAIMIHFKLIKNIGPTRAATVTFLIPIFSFIWGYLLLGEQVTLRMLIATAIILLGMSFVMGFIKLKQKVVND